MSRSLRASVTLLIGLSLAVSVSAVAQTPEEGVRVREMPAPGAHWAFLVSPLFGAFGVSAVTIVDGDRVKILGMITGGALSTAAVSPDHRLIYMADTFYSRGARGDRTDVLSIYDAKTLAAAGEVILPPKRQLSAPDDDQLGVTPDGKFVLVANMTPATSVTVVDIGARKVVGEIEIPGCTELRLTGRRQFTSICGDGSLLAVDFDESGKPVSSKRMAHPFFNPEKDPVFATPAMIESEAYYVSYQGMVYPVDDATNPPTAGKPWSLVTDAERAEKWKPGGWQPVWAHAKRGLLYVLMHQGEEWSHKQPAREVWVFDTAQGKRVDRLALPDPALVIYVTQDDNPLIFATSPGDPFAAGGEAPRWYRCFPRRADATSARSNSCTASPSRCSDSNRICRSTQRGTRLWTS